MRPTAHRARASAISAGTSSTTFVAEPRTRSWVGARRGDADLGHVDLPDLMDQPAILLDRLDGALAVADVLKRRGPERPGTNPAHEADRVPFGAKGGLERQPIAVLPELQRPAISRGQAPAVMIEVEAHVAGELEGARSHPLELVAVAIGDVEDRLA